MQAAVALTVEGVVTDHIRQGAKVLSGDVGSPYALDAAGRTMMCLVRLNDEDAPAVLLVSASHRLDPNVLAYQDRLKRERLAYKTLSCGMQVLQDAYRMAPQPASGNTLDDGESAVQAFVLDLVREATVLRASDVHIIVKEEMTQVLMRVDGVLRTLREMHGSEGMRVCATIYQSMCDVAEPTFKPMQAQRARMKGEFLSSVNLSGGRINTRPLSRGMLMVIRLLYRDAPGAEKSFEELGYLPGQIQLVEQLLEGRYGIVLLSGPTGSGKSTTLKAAMQQIMKTSQGIHLLTLEDPPEYDIDGANQSPVTGDRSDVGDVEQQWANAIADAMRLDPDVIMIGEVRDSVTARMAFRAAMTGHLIWTTIHANDALAILPRLRDEGVHDSLLLDPLLLTGLINQQLVQILCPDCKVPLSKSPDEVPPRLMQRLEKYSDPSRVFLKGAGCPTCRMMGSKGRTVVAEVISNSQGLMNAFSKGGHHGALEYWVAEMGGQRKVDVLLEKINAGIVDPRAGERVIGPIQGRYQAGGRHVS